MTSEQLDDLARQDEIPPLTSVGGVRRVLLLSPSDTTGGRLAVVFAFEEKVDKEVKSVNLYISNNWKKGEQFVPAGIQSKDSIEKVLGSAVRPDVMFVVQACFSLPRTDFEPVVSLPIKAVDSPELPYDLITGQHYVKSGETPELPQYSVVIDAFEPGFWASVTYHVKGKPTSSLIREIFEMGPRIAAKFVRRRGG